MSRGLYRMALEGDKSAEAAASESTKQPSIVMTGPLAEIYRKALDVAYAKKDTITGEDTVGQEDGVTAVDAVATESQANDALTLAHMRHMLAVTADAEETEENGEPSALLTVYGVSDGEVSEDIVVDLTRHLAGKPNDRDFVLILDSSQMENGNANSGVEEKFVRLGQALESMVLAHKGHVYRSLQAAADALTKR